MDIYAGALSDGGAAVLFFNRGTAPASATLQLSELPGAFGSSATVKDVWAKAALAKATGGVLHSGTVPSHGVAFLRLAKA